MAGPSGTLLSMIAQGAQPRLAEAGFQGYRQGNAVLQAQQAQSDRNALAKIAQAYGSSGPEAARSIAGQLGQLEPTMQIDKTLFGREVAAAKAAMPVSSYGKLQYDERRNLVPAGTTQRKIGAIGSGGATINVNTGNIPLGKKGINSVQDGAIADAVLLQQTRNLSNLVDDEMLTVPGRVKALYYGARDKSGLKGAKLSPQESKYLQRRTQFETTVERLFNAYRKEITGAAAAVAELDRLKKSFINMDMGPAQFRAALSSYQSELERAYNLKTQLVQAGLPPNSEQLGRTLDLLFMSGATDISAVTGGAQGQPASSAAPAAGADALFSEADAIVGN
jgi:23S rRNA pseudoU1915 N3-methylase RlmH